MFEKKVAHVFVNSFVRKLKEDGKPLSYLNYLMVFDDKNLRRQRRDGIYGWIEVDDYEIVSAFDWILHKHILPSEDIVGYSKIYAKELSKSEDNFVEVSPEELQEECGVSRLTQQQIEIDG